MTEHARLGPSSLGRFLNCPGAYKLTGTLPEGSASRSSPYAAEGSAAHSIIEDVLVKGFSPDEFLGQTLPVDGFEIEIDEDMVEAISVYIEEVGKAIPGLGRWWVEQRVDLSGLWSPEDPLPEPLFGTADFIGWEEKTQRLHVYDYKHGQGVPVGVKDNPQALAYALGAILTLNLSPLEVVIKIVQPRGQHGDPVQTWTIPTIDLIMWGEETLKPGINLAVAGTGKLVPGDWCRFCPAKYLCPALKDLAQKTAQIDFGAAELPPEPAELDNSELAEILNRAEVLALWIAAIRAEASGRMDQGEALPGWKLVPKRAVRKWTDEKAVEAQLVKLGAWDPDLTQPRKLRSVAQIEKALKKRNLQALEALAPLVDATPSGTTLVPDQDPRDAILKGPRADFEALD